MNRFTLKTNYGPIHEIILIPTNQCFFLLCSCSVSFQFAELTATSMSYDIVCPSCDIDYECVRMDAMNSLISFELKLSRISESLSFDLASLPRDLQKSRQFAIAFPGHRCVRR